MRKTFEISSKELSLDDLQSIIDENMRIALSGEAKVKVERCRAYLDNRIEQEDGLLYGINTGFGSLCDVAVEGKDLQQLQYNLVVSHACGTGYKVPRLIVKYMLLLKIQSLSYGHSGIHPDTINRLIDMYNHEVLPVIYQNGSLGASGDLAPLAHLSLPLLGLGEVYLNGEIVPTEKALTQLKWKPITLHSKEGLALLNGTQFMGAYGCFLINETKRLSRIADLIAAMSVDGFNAKLEPFHHLIHKIRPHKGQSETAERISRLLADSEINKTAAHQVQDPYSFRCIPQVNGASKDVFRLVEQTFEAEINGVTDNPVIFPEEDMVISGGNFHGQPLAMSLDYLAIGLSELGNISERRTYFLLAGQRDLPAFLVKNPGLNSGLMIPQYTAASMVSQNKQYCTPASVDSIDSSNRQEDHVSMGANAATKCYRVMRNLESILAIEMLTASQAIWLRSPMKSSSEIEAILKEYRKVVPVIETDRPFYIDIENTVQFLKTVQFTG